MTSTPSIIATNARGSNCDYWVRDNLVLRITPRQNLDVNEYWLADEDRLTYNAFNEGRASWPRVQASSTGWDAAYDRAAELLHEGGSATFFLRYADAHVADNYLPKKLAEAVGADTPPYTPHIEPGPGDDWLITY